MHTPTNATPAASPRNASFVTPGLYHVGGGRAYAPRHPRCKVASLRGALVASGANPARVARVLAAALAAHKAGQPLPWPRGYAPA